jgi:hypothetical protein
MRIVGVGRPTFAKCMDMSGSICRNLDDMAGVRTTIHQPRSSSGPAAIKCLLSDGKKCCTACNLAVDASIFLPKLSIMHDDFIAM